MKIRSVRLKGYKQYADEEIVFGDGLNIIVGEGGTGKSTLYEAIKQISTPGAEVLFDGEPSGRSADIIFADGDPADSDDEYRILARDNKMPYEDLLDEVVSIYAVLYDDLEKIRPSAHILASRSIGEKKLMTYPFLLAGAKILGGAPLVVDDALRYLDRVSAGVLLKHLCKVKSQVILFMTPAEYEMIAGALYGADYNIMGRVMMDPEKAK